MKIHKDIKNKKVNYSTLELKEKYVSQADIIKIVEDYIDKFEYKQGYCYKYQIMKHLMNTKKVKSCVSDLSKIVDEVILKRHTPGVDDANTL